MYKESNVVIVPSRQPYSHGQQIVFFIWDDLRSINVCIMPVPLSTMSAFVNKIPDAA